MRKGEWERGGRGREKERGRYIGGCGGTREDESGR